MKNLLTRKKNISRRKLTRELKVFKSSVQQLQLIKNAENLSSQKPEIAKESNLLIGCDTISKKSRMKEPFFVTKNVRFKWDVQNGKV